jgi:FkbM family methyltransferase
MAEPTITLTNMSRLERLLVAYARKFPVRRGKLRIIDRLWRAAVAKGDTRRVANLKYGGMKMACDLTGMLQRQFYFFGTYFLEEQILSCWAASASEAKVIFDVGANFGIYSLVALASQPNAIVHAFEPTPEIARSLREAAELNCLKSLFVHEVAVSSQGGQAKLQRVHSEANEGMNYICSSTGGVGEEQVRTICLDEFCTHRKISNIDLLKLDVQGHESSVLKGTEDLIRRGAVGTIYMELNWASRPDSACAATECIRLLDEVGYWFASPADFTNWRPAGGWLRSLNDVIARRVNLRMSGGKD